jgi:tRNA1(Val) A37 N6-methylase TrmN6
MQELMGAAAWALKFGGDFYLVHRPERMAELFACAAQHKLEPKRLLLLRHRTDREISLILVQCRKGGNPGLKLEEASLYDQHGQPTAYYRELYHTQEEP